MSNFKIQMSNKIQNPNVKKSEEEKQWNEFLVRNGGSFLQSWEWGIHQSFFQKDWFKLKIKNETPHQNKFGTGQELKITNQNSRINEIVLQGSIFKHRLPLGFCYFYCPRGPAILRQAAKWNFQFPISNFQLLLTDIKKIAEKEKAIFLRIDPEWEDNEENRQILKSLGFKKAPKEIQPKNTLILDITQTEEQLLAEMHPKTRYNIRLAEKHRIQVHLNNVTRKDIVTFEEFWRLMQQTAKRDKFRPHPKEHYRQMLEIFEVESPNIDVISGGSAQKNHTPTAKLFSAEYQGKIIAANIVVLFGKRATYLHGAFDYNFRNLMAPYLLQWEQIKEVKRFGCVEYDFWGIDEKKWPGLTRFKKGFGGNGIEFIGALDYIFRPFWYGLYSFAETIL